MFDFTLKRTIPAAMSMLPDKMDGREARVMLLAIGLQESRFEYRRQIKGPARGFWQFEEGGGVKGVLTHHATRDHARAACNALCYSPLQSIVYPALADNDVLACVFARLLLWSHPEPLATTAEDGWKQYLDTWRPGKPHPETWPALFEKATKGA